MKISKLAAQANTLAHASDDAAEAAKVADTKANVAAHEHKQAKTR